MLVVGTAWRFPLVVSAPDIRWSVYGEVVISFAHCVCVPDDRDCIPRAVLPEWTQRSSGNAAWEGDDRLRGSFCLLHLCIYTVLHEWHLLSNSLCMKHNAWGWGDGSAGNCTCCQAWWTKFHPWNPQWMERTDHCPLTSIHVLPQQKS